jgi:hypothetical protein
MIALRNRLVPETDLDRLMLREHVKAKAGTSLVLIPVLNNPKLVGRVNLENLKFGDCGSLTSTIDIEPVNLNYCRKTCLDRFIIRFWIERAINIYGQKIQVYWELPACQISKQIQINNLPRLPKIKT